MSVSGHPSGTDVVLPCREFLDLLPSGVVVQDRDGAIIYANGAAERILGLTRDQMAGRSSLDPRWRTIHEDGTAFPGEDHPAMVVLASGQPCLDVLMGVHKPEGALTWINIHSVPLFAPGENRPWAALTQFVDATTSKLAAESLEGSARGFRNLLDDLNAIVWEVDTASMMFTYVSRQAERVLGYPMARWYESAAFWPSIIHPDDREWAIAFCAQETSSGRYHEFTYRALAADGSVHWIEDRVAVVPKAGGPPLLRGLMIDVTGQKEAERESERARSLLRAIIDASEDFIFVKDTERRLLLANSAYARALGKPTDRVAGLSDLEQVPDEAIVATWEEDDRKALAGETVHNPQDVARIGGRLRTYDTIKTPLRDADGRIMGLVAIARDVSDRRTLEQALLSARAAATTGRIAATVAHEINNPLAAMLSQLELLQSGLEERPEDLATIALLKGQIQRIARTVRNLLGFARHRAEPEARTADVLRTVMDLFAATYASRGIHLVAEIPGVLPPTTAESDGLQEILVNLLENGREVLGDGRTLRVEARATREVLVLSCDDDGPGFEGDPERLFTPFYTTKPHGSGLGLTIARQLAESFGGTLHAERLEPGARFIARIPIAR